MIDCRRKAPGKVATFGRGFIFFSTTPSRSSDKISPSSTPAPRPLGKAPCCRFPGPLSCNSPARRLGSSPRGQDHFLRTWCGAYTAPRLPSLSLPGPGPSPWLGAAPIPRPRTARSRRVAAPLPLTIPPAAAPTPPAPPSPPAPATAPADSRRRHHQPPLAPAFGLPPADPCGFSILGASPARDRPVPRCGTRAVARLPRSLPPREVPPPPRRGLPSPRGALPPARHFSSAETLAPSSPPKSSC